MKTLVILFVSTFLFQAWTKLGDVTVSSKFDNESIILSGNENCKTIRLKAINDAIQISGLDFYYQSGDVQNLTKKMTIDKGAESETIPLKPGQKLKKIVFYYKLFPGKENEDVLIELYGTK
ncbi:MAG: hypothetical protein ACJ77K_09055 [Bacteroidia bacterium]